MGQVNGSVQVGQHAVVLGGSLAGLAAAAGLAPRFARVTVVERDAVPPVGEGRRGVPQGAHAHLLLPGGLRALEDLLPGIVDDVRARGGHRIPAPEFRFHLGAGRLALTDPTMAITGATRPLLEGVVRSRVAALANVSLADGREVDGLLTDAARARVTGVRLVGDGRGDPDVVQADLVVDATGRRSGSPRWLEALGYRAPDEERMHVGVHYSTRLFHRDPSDLGGCRHVLVAAPPGERRGGLALAVEGDRWLVTLVGILGERPPTDPAGFAAYAAGLWRPDLHQIVDGAEPSGDATTGGFPAYLRRRYDRLRRFPERYVVVGDAVCSLSPVYAQGMTVAAGEARALGQTLDRHGLDRVGPRFFRRTRSLVGTAWTLATGADLADPGIDGRRPLGWRLLNRYLDRLLRAAERDPVVADAFLAVNALVAPPPSLMAPRVAARVVRRRPARDGGAGAGVPATPGVSP
jgi:2-polyprenyl-6-methoxyphenol hydroxylase-like FAD-dependent oxidoreductase